ncbi:peptidoglycan DD-metalloendopeptidase family protein [Pseudoduganella sp. FT26W]|uniref:Peptidoglycan DD-metalloendopeptidase family protein n=1 Tax=Duganella aquatilis TaxID=2666082 RepID=A0A844DE13_9BURK|nr:peptidoglycan DD-metalloendopeptidase family protein [Duganella aquatilis]MRW86390.1 peptidoglycan DD-metalloendopeptidase family protein [Duganella aquatilis]
MLSLGANAAPFGKTTERSKQKAVAEAERAGLQQKLSTLKKDISKTESAKDDAADTLAESEAAISDANRALRDLQQEQGDTNVKLQQLSSEHERLAATVAQQKQQLAKLLREQYVAGNEDRIKLLLSGDNPNRINRDLQMLSYVSQAQARLLEALRTNLKAVEVNQEEAQNAKDELEEIAQEQLQQKARLEQEKGRRAALLSTLSKKLVSQRKEAGNLERDEQRMTSLVDKLSKLIAEQAAAAAAEKKRQEQVAAAKAAAKAKADADARALAKARAAEAERQRLAKANTTKSGAIKPAAPNPADAIDADEPPKVAAVKPAPAPEPVNDTPAKPADIALAPVAPAGAFASLKGQLKAPVAGKITSKFGSRRGDGPTWKGVFIRASEGAEVHAVATGRVVIAEWMRGFGNLIIIDHGGQYLSLYANNEALLKRPGDVVKPGEVIASVGNTGSSEESGLYFELRHQGATFDPAGWVKF